MSVQRSGLRTLSVDQERALDILIRIFFEQLDDIAHDASSDSDRLLHAIAQLQVKCFVFFKIHSPIDEQSLVSLHTISCHIIRSARALDESQDFLSKAPTHFRFGLLLAAYVLLRLLKSPYAAYLDDEVKNCFLSTIEMAKRLSAFSGDPPHKHATALTQLLGSQKAFRKSDGSDFTVLRLRTRLTMSIVFAVLMDYQDALWWWKEEFQGQTGLFDSTASQSESHTSNISTPSANANKEPSTSTPGPWGLHNTSLSMFDDRILDDIELGTNLDSDLFMSWPDVNGGQNFSS
ncbi:MAG: hypothetical protein Q9162_004624 [Coniocarpon cinnabarinum]